MDDTIDYLKGERIPFLTKYGQSIGVGDVVPVRDFAVQAMQVGVRKSPLTTTLEAVKEGISSYIDE